MVKRLSEEQHKTVRARQYRPFSIGEKEQINKRRMVRRTEVNNHSSLVGVRFLALNQFSIAEWSSWSARVAHNHEVVGSNPTSATNFYGALVYRLVQRIVDPLGRVRLPYAPPILWNVDRAWYCAVLLRRDRP